MSKNGPMTEGDVLIPPVKEKKKVRSSHINKVKENISQHDLPARDSPSEDFKVNLPSLISIADRFLSLFLSQDFDTDSGVSSLRHSRGKLATSASKTNVGSDDDLDDEALGKVGSERLHSDDGGDRRSSDATSITDFTINKTSSQFLPSTRNTSFSSAGVHPITPLPSMVMPAHHRLAAKAASAPGPPTEQKNKGGMKKFIRKIFGSGASASKHSSGARATSLDVPQKSPQLNIDLAHGTAYPSTSPLPITQGPIRLLLLRHGERLDRFYSSQWLRQAFDKDGNYCRFSPILPYVK